MPEPDETKHRDESNGNPEATPTGAASSESQLKPELSVSPNSIEGLFLQALQLPSPADREAFLDRSCQNDPENRKRVLALLRAHANASDFLENPAVDRPTNDKISLGFLKPSDKEGVLGTIGPYEVLEAIGRGGMGVVLRACDPKLNRIVAVKALLPELASNPNSRRRFLREAQAAAAISHPHVVSIHAVDDSDQDHSGTPVPPFLVMECIVGQSLQQKLDKVGPLRLTEILRISRQISDGLAAAHKQGLVHRDIKPANILLENGVERVKITDFGLARAIDDITVTRTGEVCGTPQYMSPEQACGDRVDHRSDLFSLGCVMYAMCTGHSPFRGDSIAHVIKRVTQDEPRSIAAQNPEIPLWLIEIINSLLQKKAERRFQSAEDLALILDKHLSRIQNPSESGSHSAINEQVPYRNNGASQRDRESVAPSVPEFSPLAFLERSSQFLVPGWMRSTSRIFAFACVIVWMLLGFNAMDGWLGIGRAEFFILSFLNIGPFLMAIILSRRTVAREVLAIALFLGLGPLGLLGYLWIKDHLTQAARPTGHIPPRNPKAPANAVINDKGGLTTKIDTGWLSYRFVYLSVILVVASMLILPSLWLVSLALRDAMNGNRISILDREFWTYVFAQKTPTLAVLGVVIAATFQTIFTIIERRKHRRLTLQAYSQTAFDTDSKPVDAPVASSTPENVSMQFGSIITPVPLESALHYTTVKSIGRAWILLTLGGIVLSLVLQPTLSLAANPTQLITQAFQYPATMLGIWIMSMLGTKIFNPYNVQLRTWTLLSSTIIGCMAFGFFWSTVVRMPFSGNLNDLSSRSLIGVAILPTMIFLLYCSWVYLEIIKNPKTLQGAGNLTGLQARLSNRKLLVLVSTVVMLLAQLPQLEFWKKVSG